MSVVCNVRALHPTQGVQPFGNIFVIVYLSYLLTSLQNFTEIIPGKPLRRGAKL